MGVVRRSPTWVLALYVRAVVAAAQWPALVPLPLRSSAGAPGCFVQRRARHLLP